MAKRVKIPGRLESAETGNIVTGADAIMDDAKGKTQVVINSEVDAAIISLAQGKQDALTFDSAPTEGSPNPVTSAGVYTADKVLSDAIEAILLLIPSAASALNKLVDMQTMNSSIATATASFKGTYNLVSDLHLGVDATHEQIGAALDALSLGADNNDYAFVQVPNSATAPTEIRVTERYKFNGTNWLFEYDLNNSGFTQGQWNAINSGVTSLLVGKLSDLPTNAELTTLLAGKQDNLTFDNVPKAGSPNPVKSGGVYARNNEIVALINALDVAKQDVLTFDNAPVEGSPNPVKSGGVYTAISAVQAAIVALDAAKQNVLTFDSTPTLGSTNPVTSSGIKTELNRIDGNITMLNDLYEALTQSALVIVQSTDTWPVASPASSTIYRVVDRVNTPPQYYSDYMWNGSAMVLMAQYDNAIDDVPTAGSDNLVKSGGVAKTYGWYENNPEYIVAKTDGDDRLLEARKVDGTKVEFGDLEVKGDIINTGFQNKIDKESGKSLIDEDFASSQSAEENPEWLNVCLDREEKIIEGINKDGNKVINTLLLLSKEGIQKLSQDLGLENPVVQISVKKDGTGDFTNIQDAINSITDASKYKQYEILVYDDFVSESLTDLRLFDNPVQHVTSMESINSAVVYVYAKDYIHITGMGRRRKVWFLNPDLDTPGSKFQYIHDIYVRGNCKISNLDIRIKGGRYAIHQDSSGNTNPLTNPDVDATTIYENCHIEHLGNSDYQYGASWGTEAALAACCASGQTIKVIDCHIEAPYSSPLILHLNESYKNPTSYVLKGTTVVCNNPSEDNDEIGTYFAEMGSRQRNDLTIIGCDLKISTSPISSRSGKETYTKADARCSCWDVHGYANTKNYCQVWVPASLAIVTASVNKNISVIGGSAKSILFGEDIKYYLADTETKGGALGGMEVHADKSQVGNNYSYSLSLPYILGNCASNPKNLIISVDGVQHEIVFNQNYMTSDGSSFDHHTVPAISGNEIIAAINAEFSSYFSILFAENTPYSSHSFFPSIYSFSDCMEQGLNYSEKALLPLQCVKRDLEHGYNCWKIAGVGEVPDGIVGERIDGVHDGKYSAGNILLVEKVIFGFDRNIPRYWLDTGMEKGDTMVVGSDGYLIKEVGTDNGPFVALSPSTFIFK